MTAEYFYKTLDTIIPGGELSNLDKTNVPQRNIYLTRISLEGLEGMHEYSKDERLYQYLEFEPFKTIDETKAYLQKLIERMGSSDGRKNMYWFIRLIENNKIIGSIGLVEIDLYRSSGTWGYAISPEYWGKGYILEAQLLVMAYFFEVLKLNRLWGTTMIDNQPTISSVLAAGFQKEGILRDYYKKNGERKDCFMYSLLAKDYFAKEKKNDPNAHALTLDQLKKLFAKVFNVDPARIKEETTIINLAEWDSLNHVVLISLIEKETSFKFKPSQIASATSVKAILRIVNQGKVQS